MTTVLLIWTNILSSRLKSPAAQIFNPGCGADPTRAEAGFTVPVISALDLTSVQHDLLLGQEFHRLRRFTQTLGVEEWRVGDHQVERMFHGRREVQRRSVVVVNVTIAELVRKSTVDFQYARLMAVTQIGQLFVHAGTADAGDPGKRAQADQSSRIRIWRA